MAAQFRTEQDSLGAVLTPRESLYGAQTVRAIHNYPISGLRAHPQLIRSFAMVKYAAAYANRALGLLDKVRSSAIMQAAQELMDGEWNSEIVVDVFQAGAGVSLHMNVNEVLANRANQILGKPLGSYSPVHPNDHVNYGQSTNDVFPTAMRLATLLNLESLYPVLASAARSFQLKAKEFDSVVKAGRTHMQDAVPIRLGQEFAAYGQALAQAEKAIALAAESLRDLGLGGSAVGTGLNTHPEYRRKAITCLEEISGQKLRPAEDLRWAMQSNAPIAQVSSSLRNLALELLRITNDLRLLSSGPNTGLGEISLPALQPGSSIMPGKVNPVLPEMMAMICFQVIGGDTALGLAAQAGQLELNVMMPTMAFNILSNITWMGNGLRQLDWSCIRGITADKERCADLAGRTVALATALNPILGYAKTAEIVKEAISTGGSVLSLVEQSKLIDPKRIEELLNPYAMTEPKTPEAGEERRTGT